MGRSRDIADMLSKTELANTNNERLIIEDTVGVDSAYVSANALPALSFFNTLDSLPVTGLTSGQQAYVDSNNRLYISDGSGWYNKAFITLTPTITLDPSGTIVLSNDGVTTSTVTVVAVDSDTPGSGLTYSVDSDGNGIGKYVISQDSSVFTIRPLSSDSGATEGTFALTFSATDGDNIATDSSSFSLTFQNVSGINFTPTDTITRLTSTYGNSTNLNISQTGYQNGDTIPYTITGVTSGASGDITNSLTGNVTIGSTFTLQGSGVDSTKTLGDKTGTMTVGGQSDTFDIQVKLAGRQSGSSAGAPFDSNKYIIVRDGLFAYTDTTSTRLTFGRFSNSTNAQLFQGFLLGRAHGQINTTVYATGNAGNNSWTRDWRSIKIYGLINNVVTHTHTFSWARNCGEMAASSGQSSSNYYVTLGSIDSTPNYCTRDYTLASYSGVNINNIYFIEFHANSTATSLINTSYWNGVGSLLV